MSDGINFAVGIAFYWFSFKIVKNEKRAIMITCLYNVVTAMAGNLVQIWREKLRLCDCNNYILCLYGVFN